jgi:hypothetical protein
MANFVPLSFEEHKRLRLATRYGVALGDGLGMVSVVPTEIPALITSYPLFFRRSPATGRHELGAMLGFAAEENLFLSDDGWDASLCSAHLRRAPFAVQQSAASPDRNSLMIDLDSPRLSLATGDVLFFSDGRPSERLQAIVDALEALVKGAGIGRDYADVLDALGLIEPVDVRIDLGNGITHIPRACSRSPIPAGGFARCRAGRSAPARLSGLGLSTGRLGRSDRQSHPAQEPREGKPCRLTDP